MWGKYSSMGRVDHRSLTTLKYDKIKMGNFIIGAHVLHILTMAPRRNDEPCLVAGSQLSLSICAIIVRSWEIVPFFGCALWRDSKLHGRH